MFWRVTVSIEPITGGWSREEPRLCASVGIEADNYADALRQMHEKFPVLEKAIPVGMGFE